MVAIGRSFSSPPGLRQRAAVDLPAVLLVLTPIAMLNVLVGIRPSRAPGPAEVDAVVGASLGIARSVGTGLAFLWQLWLVQEITGAAWGASLLQSARGLCLLASLLAAALVWPVLRRLGLGGNAAATAVIVAGLAPIALRLQPTVDPGALAAFWLALAAATAAVLPSGPLRAALVVPLLVLAAVTAPLAAGGLLALLAQLLLAGRLASWLRPGRRRALAGSAAAGALGVLVSVLPVVAGGAGGRGVLPLPSLLAIELLGAWVLVRAWSRRPDLRVLTMMIVFWLVAAVVAGPARLTALLLAVPALALLVGGLLGPDTGPEAADRSPKFSIAASTAVTVALVSGLVTVLWPPAPPVSGSYQPLARWLSTELDERVVLSAAPLDRAELVAAGVPVGRFATDSVPDGSVTVVPSDAGCGAVGTPVVRLAVATGVLSVCAPATRNAVMLSAGAGPHLAGSPTLRIAEPARQLLLDGRVDSRLVTVLAGAATIQPVEVADFRVVPGESPDAPRRVAVLAGVNRPVDVNGQPAASGLELYLNAQQPPFRPNLRGLPDGRLLVHFRLPVG